jgi:hypothetical protein
LAFDVVNNGPNFIFSNYSLRVLRASLGKVNYFRQNSSKSSILIIMNIHQFFYGLFRFLSILSNKILEGSEIDQFPAILTPKNWNGNKII